MQVKLILCPVDFSDFSVNAYEYALTLAGYYKAHLVVLHTIELSKYHMPITLERPVISLAY